MTGLEDPVFTILGSKDRNISVVEKDGETVLRFRHFEAMEHGDMPEIDIAGFLDGQAVVYVTLSEDEFRTLVENLGYSLGERPAVLSRWRKRP